MLTSYLEDVDEFSDVLTEKVLVIRGNSITSTRCELNGAFPIVIKVWERERVSFANMEKEMYTTTTDLPSVKSNLVFLAGDSKFFTKLSKFKSSQVGLFYLREDGETKEISYKVCEFSNWTEFKKGEECKNAMSVIVQTLYNSNDDRSLRLLLLIKPGNKSAHLVAFDLKTETIVRHKDLGNIFYGSIEETLPPHQLFSLE